MKKNKKSKSPNNQDKERSSKALFLHCSLPNTMITTCTVKIVKIVKFNM